MASGYYPSTCRKEIEDYARLVAQCAANGLAFPESPFPSLAKQARELYERECERLAREITQAKRIRVVKCHSCGAPLTRSKCAYCGTAHIVSQGAYA